MVERRRRPMRNKKATAITLALVAIAALTLTPVMAADSVAAQGNETEDEACEADIDSFDVHTADDTIEGADDPGLIGVSASTSITNGCNVVLQVTFDIPNNMYYQGTSAGSSGQGLQTEVFEVQPGEVSSFTTQLYANREGEHTVVADVEYFPEGQPEKARTLDNFMLTLNAVDTGFPSDTSGSDEASTSDETSTTDEVSGDSPPEDDNDQMGPLLSFLEGNLGIVSIFTLSLVLAVGLIKREPIVNIITGGK